MSVKDCRGDKWMAYRERIIVPMVGPSRQQVS